MNRQINSAASPKRWFPPYDPRLMVKLLIYGYMTGVRSSRAIEKACHDDVAFRFLAANQTPDFRSVARFRRRHLAALDGLFLEILKMCQQAGMVKLGRVALDGSKVRANASRRKAMSYKRMTEREADLQGEVDDLLRDAEAADVEEDDKFGPDGRDDDLGAEMARRESRLAKIRRAKADLEAEAKRHAAADAARRTWHKTAGRDDATAEQRYEDTTGAADRAAAQATVPDKAQRNFTDPDSRIMKTSDGSFHYCYNAQTAADEANQVIVATRLSNRSADCPEFVSLLDEITANCGASPDQVVAGAGYARRKAIIKPVFGQIDTVQGGKQVLLRRQDAAAQEWRFMAACHNIRKLVNYTVPARPAPT